MQQDYNYREHSRIPVISPELHKKMWGVDRKEPSATTQKIAKAVLERFEVSELEPTGDLLELPLPYWLPSCKEAVEIASRYVTGDIPERITELSLQDVKTPQIPIVAWKLGWWNNKSGTWERCEPPSDALIILDSETVKLSSDKDVLEMMPVCACAYDARGFWWYWCNNLNPEVGTRLIPMGQNNIIIAHNAGYDRSILTSSYEEEELNYFVCTMALSIPVRGVSNQQQGALNGRDDMLYMPEWLVEASSAGLGALYEFHTGRSLPKDTRNRIWDEGLGYVVPNSREVLSYCMQDVAATHTVLGYVWGEFKESFPNLATFAGNLIVSRERLPIDGERWDNFYPLVSSMYEKRLTKISDSLMQIAEDTCNKVLETGEKDIWVQQLDNWICGKSQKGELLYGKDILKGGPCKGKPRWYSKILSKYKKDGLTLHQIPTPWLLKILYRDRPVILMELDPKKGKGWTDGKRYLPHPDSREKVLKDLFIKGLIKSYEHGVLRSTYPELAEVINLSNSIQHMSMFRNRYREVRVYDIGHGAYYLPICVVMGAISGRTTDPVARVASKANPIKIGTSFQSHNKARKGWVFVGFDFDGQELRIACMFADALKRLACSDPLSVTQIAGDKTNATDVHSRVAKKIFGGVDKRDLAKTLVYALMYQQGLKGAIENILAVCPHLNEEEGAEMAKLFHLEMKGYKDEDGFYRGGLASEVFNAIAHWADLPIPTSPYLGNKITKALRFTRDYKTTRHNWVIQNTGRGMLNVVLALFKWLADELDIPHQLIITIHDCVRYEVPIEYQERAAYLLAVAHQMVWAHLAQALGMDTLPLSGLYPEAIEIDYIWRKSPKDPCKTPEYPEGFEPGRMVTVKELLYKLFNGGLDGEPNFTQDIMYPF